MENTPWGICALACGEARDRATKIKTIRKAAWLEIKPLAKETVDQYEFLARYLASPGADESKALQIKQDALVLQQKIAAF